MRLHNVNLFSIRKCFKRYDLCVIIMLSKGLPSELVDEEKTKFNYLFRSISKMFTEYYITSVNLIRLT